MSDSNFNHYYFQALELLDAETKRLFLSALVGGLSVYLPEGQAKRLVESALDTAQGFSPQLVRVK